MTEDGFEETRATMERAIRRLNALEYAMLAVAMIFALAGGAVVAFLFVPPQVPFWLSWSVLSLLLFLIPAVGVARKESGGGSVDENLDGPTRIDEADDRR